MIPIKQAYDDDCESAAIASILELPLALVPRFRQKTGKAQLTAVQKWLGRLGYTLLEIPYTEGGTSFFRMDVPLYAVVNVKLKNKAVHAMVAHVCGSKLEIVHDPSPEPHPTDDIRSIESVAFLVPIAPRVHQAQN